jgi:hypothetical protein
MSISTPFSHLLVLCRARPTATEAEEHLATEELTFDALAVLLSKKLLIARKHNHVALRLVVRVGLVACGSAGDDGE